MRIILALAVAFVVSNTSRSIAQESNLKTLKERRAVELANSIEDSVLRTRALAVLGRFAGDLESALILIEQCQSHSDKLNMLRKVVSSSKFKPVFDRALTPNELKQLEKAIGPATPSEHSGVSLLAMIYLEVNLDRTRIAQSVRIIDKAPSGVWRDTVYFSAIYALMTRTHVTTSIRGSKLRIDDCKRVPASFVTQAEEIAKKIENGKLQDYAHVLLAMAASHRPGEVDRAILHIKKISSAELRDKTRLQAVYVLVTGKASSYDTLHVTLSPQEMRRFTSHRN